MINYGYFRKVMKSLFYFGVLMLGMFAAGYLFLQYIDRPYKLVSYSSKECVGLIMADGTSKKCSELEPNQKYIHVWVK